MNANQEAKLNMYRTTADYCTANNTIISANVAFVAAFNEFKTKTSSIMTTMQQESVNITGITQNKNKWKLTLCQTAADIAGVIYAYAVTTANDPLKQKVNYTYSDLIRTREESLTARCQTIHDAAVENDSALLNYGVTTAMITDLEAAITNFSAQTPKPRVAINERKTLRTNLVALFKETDTILQDRMDKIVVTFKAAHPDFVKTYESARKIVDPPHTTTQLKGTVADKATATPIKDAKVTVTATPETVANNSTTATADPITVQTDASGEYLFKPLPFGEYTMTVTASGYTQFDSDIIDVKLGEVNEFDVALSN